MKGRPLVFGLAMLALVSLPLRGQAADRGQEIPLTIENHQFSQEEVAVPAGVPFRLVVTNKDKTPEEFESKALHLTKKIPAGKTVRLKVPALKAGTYDFVGEYHEKTARGHLVAK